jgi:chorismate dehydratase
MRFGSVPYLNAKPLHIALHPTPQLFPPVVLAEKLQTGELDAALVPVVECLLNPIYQLVDGVGICCLGAVHSVILTGSVPLPEAKTIALDAESKTSVLLLRVLLEKYLKLTPKYISENSPSDQHLRIGDQALTHRRTHPHLLPTDLGQLWFDHTGLPFVFAVWAIRPGLNPKPIAREIRAAQGAGLAQRKKIAAAPSDYRYLTENIRYLIGTAQKQGLLRFSEDLVELRILKNVPELQWI